MAACYIVRAGGPKGRQDIDTETATILQRQVEMLGARFHSDNEIHMFCIRVRAGSKQLHVSASGVLQRLPDSRQDTDPTRLDDNNALWILHGSRLRSVRTKKQIDQHAQPIASRYKLRQS